MFLFKYFCLNIVYRYIINVITNIEVINEYDKRKKIIKIKITLVKKMINNSKITS